MGAIVTSLLASFTIALMAHAAQDNAPPPNATPAESPAMILLKAADTATRQVTAVSYEAEFRGTGALAGREPVIEGTMLKAFRNQNAEAMSIRGEGWLFTPANSNTTPWSYIATFDGVTARLLHHQRKEMMEAPANSAGEAFGPIINADMREYGHPTPFQDEINAKVQTLEGRTMVGDVLCDIVYVEYDIEPPQSARWYLGVEDHLPRKVERLNSVDGRVGATVLTLRNVVVNPAFEPSNFTLEAPEGYSRRAAGGPTPTANPVGVGGGGRGGG